jgi:hypothetical protein
VISEQRAHAGIVEREVAAPRLGVHDPARTREPRVVRLHHGDVGIAERQVERGRDEKSLFWRDRVLGEKVEGSRERDLATRGIAADGRPSVFRARLQEEADEARDHLGGGAERHERVDRHDDGDAGLGGDLGEEAPVLPDDLVDPGTSVRVDEHAGGGSTLGQDRVDRPSVRAVEGDGHAGQVLLR